MVLKGDIDYFFGCPSFQGKDISEESSSRPLLAGHFSIFARSVLDPRNRRSNSARRSRQRVTHWLPGRLGWPRIFASELWKSKKNVEKKKRSRALIYDDDAKLSPQLQIPISKKMKKEEGKKKKIAPIIFTSYWS